MADPRLPTDVLIEVLIHLPVKSILKFRCVSKTWCELIKSPIFIHKHHTLERKQKVLLVKRCFPPQNGDDNDDDDDDAFSFSNLSIQSWDDLETPYVPLPILRDSTVPPQNEQGETFSFHDPEFPQVLVSPNLSIPILDHLKIISNRHPNIPIHGPCNGLVCIAFEKAVLLCNPALREFKPLPPLSFPVGYIAFPFQYGFGFDPITGTYKVIQISDMRQKMSVYADHSNNLCKNNKIRFDLYNSASNSWKQIIAKVPDIIHLPDSELFYNRTIHWFAITYPISYTILCFDVSTDAFRQLDFHDVFCPSDMYMRLMDFNDSLAIVRYSGYRIDQKKIEIWVMKEYGVKESWTKQLVVGPYLVICPFWFLKNELLVESDQGQLATCALHEKQFKRFQFFGAHHSMSAVVYEESLISLNQIIASDLGN